MPAKTKTNKTLSASRFKALLDGNNISVSKVLNSRIFSGAMNVASKISYSKSRVFRLLQHAFDKLRMESDMHSIESDIKTKFYTLMRLVKAYYRGDYRKVPASVILRIVGGLVYFVWFLDVIPDFIPIVGFADDVAVIIWIWNGLSGELEDFERWESVNAVSIDGVQAESNGHTKTKKSTSKQNS